MFYWLKAFHIVGVVVWFAGLFYLVRLFVYHREAEERAPEAREILQAQFSIMESRLLNIITTPGMILTVGTASGLIYTNPNYYLSQGWMHAKLGLVCALICYHFFCFYEFTFDSIIGESLLNDIIIQNFFLRV